MATEVAGADAPVVGAGGLLWSIYVGGGALDLERTVVGFDPTTGTTAVSFALPRAFELAVGPDGLWVYSLPGSKSQNQYVPGPKHPAEVFLIDPGSRQIRGVANVSSAPVSIAASKDGLWISQLPDRSGDARVGVTGRV